MPVVTRRFVLPDVSLFMKMKRLDNRGETKTIIVLLALCLIAPFVQAAESSSTDYSLPSIERLSDSGSAIDRRILLEAKSRDNPFVITPHKPTYILPATYNSNPNLEPYGLEEGDLEHAEIKFQFSLKISLLRNLFKDNGHLSFGYTQQSYWQAYNSAFSSPFRETNHEPELMLNFITDFELFGVRNRVIGLGVVHQSNGQTGALSRSWNRVYANLILEHKDSYFRFKPWWRIPESETSDDNPDIEDFLGNFEITALRLVGRQTYGLMLRNNLGDPNRGAAQLDWTFPLTKRVKGYLQYFNGYGESLIDYNHYSNRIGFGVMLVDWL